MNSTKRLLFICVVFIACVGCDQTTKSIANSLLPEGKIWSYLGDTVRLERVHNAGAFLSLGASLPEAWRRGMLLVGVACLLLGVLAWGVCSKPGRPRGVLAAALLFSGGVSNLIDRIVHGGTVVDFINIGIGPLRTGIFNVADVAITIGGLILFWEAFVLSRRKTLYRKPSQN